MLKSPGWVLLILVTMLPCVAATAGATMSISLQPDTAYVQVAQEFVLDFTVDFSDSLFNSYEAVIQWDPAQLQYVDVQAGPLMPPGFWYEVAAGADSVRIRHAITYGVYGPGVVSQLTLRAIGTMESPVTFRRATFSYGGQHYFHPTLHGSIVMIQDPTAGETEPIDQERPGLWVAPNPAVAASHIRARLPSGGPAELALFDPTGRLLRRRQIAASGSMPIVIETELDRFLDGQILASGVYSLVITTIRDRVPTRLVILR